MAEGECLAVPANVVGDWTNRPVNVECGVGSDLGSHTP